jgi:hypothetical protein
VKTLLAGAALLAFAATSCGSNGSDRAKPSVDIATPDLVPWVAAESDGKTITVYAGFRTGAALAPVALASDDTIAATVGGDTVTLQTFASFSGSRFADSVMFRDLTQGLSDGVYYSAVTPVKTTEPIDISVELRRASTRGGPANVAKMRLVSPEKITSPVPPSVPLGGKLEVCWETAQHTEALPDFKNEVGTFGLCTLGTTTFTSTVAGTISGCQTIDYTKIALNDPKGCEVTVFARFASSGTYSAPFHGSAVLGANGKPLPPNGEAPIAWQFASIKTKLGP